MTVAAAAPAGGPSASAVIPPEPPAAGAPPPATPPVEPPATPPPAEPPAAPPAATGPATYALTLPAGGHVDADDLKKIEAMARANQWTNDDAQAFVDERAAQIQAAATGFLEETKAHPVYGGAHFDETQKHVDAAVERFRKPGTPEGDRFKAFLDKSGYGNHIEVMSFLADLGSAMAEDRSTGGLSGGGRGAEATDTATAIYGSGPQVKS
jgi:hypothetical protein